MSNKAILDRIADARLEACRRWRYASTAILSLRPVESHQLQAAAAVDARWRMYYNPAVLASESDEDLIFTIQHEVAHLLLRHHKRGAGFLVGNCPNRLELWNIACDVAIHSLLASDGIVVRDDFYTASDFGFDEGLSAEEYFGLLLDRDKEQSDDADDDDGSDGQGQGNQAGGSGGAPGDSSESGESSDGDGDAGNGPSDGDDGQSSPGTGGSCADGQQRPWEHSLEESPISSEGEAESDDAPAGLGDCDTDAICQAVADAAANGRGQGSGGLSRVADHLVEPEVSIERLLRYAIAATSAKVKSGGGHSSYRRLSRRPAVGGALRARAVTPEPNIAVIIDTSGSMQSDDTALAMGMIAKCLRSLHCQDGVRVITGDCWAASDQRAFHPRQVELVGGGGTDMELIIMDVAGGKNRPDLILCVTDGETPWPDKPTKMPVAACVTRRGPSRYYPIPSWMKTVFLKR